MSQNHNESQIRNEVCREARETLNQQIAKIRATDRKAIRLFRANLFVVGLLLTGLALIFRSNEFTYSEFINPWSAIGTSLLLLSMLLSAIAYTSSNYNIGISSTVTELYSDGVNPSNENYYDNILGYYTDWINHNRSVYKFNSALLTLAVVASFNGLVYFSGSALIGFGEIVNDALFGPHFVYTTSGIIMLDIIIILSEDIFAGLIK